MAESNQESEWLRLRYVRFQHKVDNIDKLHENGCHDLGVIIINLPFLYQNAVIINLLFL